MFRKYVRGVYQRGLWEKITQDFKQPEQDLNNNKDYKFSQEKTVEIFTQIC